MSIVFDAVAAAVYKQCFWYAGMLDQLELHVCTCTAMSPHINLYIYAEKGPAQHRMHAHS
jgi:hypothetical protein